MTSSFRNLAVAGDEVALASSLGEFRLARRVADRTKADVILAFFGFNESFKGTEGLEKFKKDLDKFLKGTKAKNYSGKGAPRLVLFSPIANEKLNDPNFPDPTANNVNLEKYTAAMAEVAKANERAVRGSVRALPTPLCSGRAEKQSLTFNGLHLTEAGDKTLAPEIFRALFGETAPSEPLEKLRAAVNEKNAEWHARYRTVDGYNVYGGRSKLTYSQGRQRTPIRSPITRSCRRRCRSATC